MEGEVTKRSGPFLSAWSQLISEPEEGWDGRQHAPGSPCPPTWPAPPAASFTCVSPISTNRTQIHTYRKVNLEVEESTRPLPQVLSTRCHLPSRYTAFQAWSNSPEKLWPV